MRVERYTERPSRRERRIFLTVSPDIIIIKIIIIIIITTMFT